MPSGDFYSLALAIVALACFLTFLLWSRLFPDNLKTRVQKLSEHTRTPVRAGFKDGDLRLEALQRDDDLPSGWFTPLYPVLNRLSKYLSPDLPRRLRRAGYYGHKPLVVFMLAKLLAPIIAFPVVWLYVDLTLAERLNEAILFAITIAFSISTFWAAELFLKNMTLRRQERIKRAWPDTLVLMQLCIESGLGLEAALSKVTQEISYISSEVSDELSITLAELIYFQNRRQALENLADRVNLTQVREVTLALAQAEKYGMALGATLNSLAAESRRVRLAEAEKKAAALPAKLTAPMILFFLPALFVVILTPAIIQVFDL